MPTNQLLNSSAVSESKEQISELYGLNWGSKVSSKKWPKIFCANKSTYEFYCYKWVYRANFRALGVKLSELGCSKKWPKIFCTNKSTFDIYCCDWVHRANFRALRVKFRELGCSENGEKYFVPTIALLTSTAVSESKEPISEL